MSSSQAVEGSVCIQYKLGKLSPSELFMPCTLSVSEVELAAVLTAGSGSRELCAGSNIIQTA